MVLVKLEQIHANLETIAKQFNCEFFQSNFEGEIVDKIQECVAQLDLNSFIIGKNDTIKPIINVNRRCSCESA